MSAYSEKLKDPRWQRKRLEILERDAFRCIGCGSNEKTLHVHHGYYEWGRDPWDYDNTSLHTLCEDCHAIAEADRLELRRAIGELNPAYLKRVIGYVRGLWVSDGCVHTNRHVNLPTNAEAVGCADALSIDVDLMLSIMDPSDPWLSKEEASDLQIL